MEKTINKLASDESCFLRLVESAPFIHDVNHILLKQPSREPNAFIVDFS